jgi:hypothetical protein
MCSYCPQPSSDPGQDKLDCRKAFDDLEAQFDALFKLCAGYEDDYRDVGLHYHSSQLAARRTPHLPQDALNKLKQFFETSRVEAYNVIFGELHDIIQTAANLRDTHLHRYHGSTTDIYHRAFRVVLPGLLELANRLEAFATEIRDRVRDARVLSIISKARYETDARGRRHGWSLPIGHDGSPTPRNKGEEWRTYRAWVWSLPETQRSVELGRMLDEIALNMLYLSVEEFL